MEQDHDGKRLSQKLRWDSRSVKSNRVLLTGIAILVLLSSPVVVKAVLEFFSQRDGPWAGKPLGYASRNPTIGDEGCALTSAAMVLRHYGVDTDPLRLNESLKEIGGFSDTVLIRWEDSARLGKPIIQGMHLDSNSSSDILIDRIDEELDKGRPVIAGFDTDSGSHFVVFSHKLAMIVHPDLPLNSLSVDQVRDIFAGKIVTWDGVGGPSAPITVVGREENSDAFKDFRQMVMGMDGPSITENTIFQTSDDSVRLTVSSTAFSIGFVVSGYLHESVKPLKIDHLTPYLIDDPWEDKGHIPFNENPLNVELSDLYKIIVYYDDVLVPLPEPQKAPERAIQEKYRSWAGTKGALGQPKGTTAQAKDSDWTRGGYYQAFEGGTIYAYPVKGGWAAVATQGAIAQKHAEYGGTSGQLGYPVTDPYTYDSALALRSDFEGGTILWYGSSTHAEAFLAEDCYKGEYHDNPDLEGDPLFVRYDPDILFDWAMGSPDPRFRRADGFSVRWTGKFDLAIPGPRTFYLFTDNDARVRVWVDDDEDPVIDHWDSVGETKHEGTKLMGRGSHIVKIEYSESGGAASVRFAHTPFGVYPVFAQEVIGPCDLMPASSEASTIPDLDAMALSASDFLLLHPGGTAQISFDIQNTGRRTWRSHNGYLLSNVRQPLGSTTQHLLLNDVPPGSTARWLLDVVAPEQLGIYRTEWQMAYDGEPFGAKASCLVAVVPEGEIDIDIAALLAQWLDELKKEIEDQFNQFLQDLANRFEEWLQRESERLLSELLESLSQQCCGAAALAPSILLLIVWTNGRRRRKRMGDRDRD